MDSGMPSIYMSGSFKFLSVMQELTAALQIYGFSCCHSVPGDPRGIVGCLQHIRDAKIIIVVNPDGYVGKSVSLDMGYAYALQKQIFSLAAITDPPIDFMVHKTLPSADLINYLHATFSSVD